MYIPADKILLFLRINKIYSSLLLPVEKRYSELNSICARISARYKDKKCLLYFP